MSAARRDGVLRAGVLAYLCTLFSGYIPVKILSVRTITHQGDVTREVRYRVTADRPGYARGYEGVTDARGACPRSCRRKSRQNPGHYFVAAYIVECDRDCIGYDGSSYGVGDRVELHPGTDLWMRGARFGTVVRLSSTPKDRVHVKLDKLPNAQPFAGSADTFRRA